MLISIGIIRIIIGGLSFRALKPDKTFINKGRNNMDIKAKAKELTELRAQIKAMESQAKAISEEFKETFAIGKHEVDGIKINIVAAERVDYDREKLKEELKDRIAEFEKRTAYMMVKVSGQIQ